MDLIAKLAFVMLLVASGMHARTAQAQTEPQGSDPNACADTGHGSNQNLSNKLSRSNGVICPPEVADPGVKQPAPNTGTMPVIPPPGSPGGKQNVQPK